MYGTITISIRDYERLKEDSDSLIKMTTDNKHYLRIFDNNQFGYRKIILIRSVDIDSFQIEAIEMNNNLLKEVEDLKKQIFVLNNMPKKKWWHI